MHLSVIIDIDNRPMVIESGAAKNAIKNLFVADSEFDAEAEEKFDSRVLGGSIKTNSVYFRPTLFFGDQLSFFLDVGLFNDVDAIVHPPLFTGGGLNITQEIIEDVNLAIYGSGYITQAYRFPIAIDFEEHGEYLANLDGRLLMGSLGTSVSTRLKLESMEILPYIGGEISVARSSATINDLAVVGQNFSVTSGIERDQRNVVVSQQDMLFMVLGITILRPNMTTLRVETKASPGNVSYSLGIGILW